MFLRRFCYLTFTIFSVVLSFSPALSQPSKTKLNPHVEALKKREVKINDCPPGTEVYETPGCRKNVSYGDWVLRDFPGATDAELSALKPDGWNSFYVRLNVIVRLFKSARLPEDLFWQAQLMPNGVLVRLVKDVESGALTANGAKKMVQEFWRKKQNNYLQHYRHLAAD